MHHGNVKVDHTVIPAQVNKPGSMESPQKVRPSSLSLADIDILSLQPEDGDNSVDSLFQTLNVTELKAIEIKCRATANAKGDELRRMVGERYRDLLSAADSIIRMQKSSNSLQNDLSTIVVKCAKDNINEELKSAAAKDDTITTQNNDIVFKFAATVKLLQDLPEHVWRAIESNDFLTAARLEGIAKVTYRYVSDEKISSENVSNSKVVASSLTYSPLIRQQGETVLHLASQIVKRATLSLQAAPTDSESTARTLAALFFLDSLSIPECLDALFNARNIYITPLLTTLENCGAHDFSFERTQARKLHNGIKQLSSTVSDIIDVLLYTIRDVENVFGSNQSNSSSALLVKLLQGTQHPEPHEINVNNNSQKSSLKQPSTHSLSSSAYFISNLPNSHLLMQYLPHQILKFSPFIDLMSKRNSLPLEILSTTKETWFEEILSKLTKSVVSVLESISSSSQLKSLKDIILDVLMSHKANNNNFAEKIQSSLLDVMRRRVAGIIRLRLDNAIESVLSLIKSNLDKLMLSQEDTNISSYIFSSQFSLPVEDTNKTEVSITLKTSRSQFSNSVYKRMKGLVPLVEEVCHELEKQIDSLSLDVEFYRTFENLAENAGLEENMTETSISLIKKLETLLEEGIATQSKLDETSIKNLFLGHIAVSFAESELLRSFFEWKKVYSDIKITRAEKLLELSKQSLKAWRQRTAIASVDLYVDGWKEEIHPFATTDGVLRMSADTSYYPSNSIFTSLHHLSKCLNEINLRCMTAPNEICEDYVIELKSRLSKTVQFSSESIMKQLKSDMQFVKEAFKAFAEYSDENFDLWIQEELHGKDNAIDVEIILQELKRKQSLLSGLCSLKRAASESDDVDIWLSIGAPQTHTSTTDLQDLIPIANKDVVVPRFAMLPESVTLFNDT